MPRHDLIQFARLAHEIASQHLQPYGSKFSPGKFTQPSLLACLCLKEYLRLDYRGLEALLASAAELRAALELRAVPDYSMFCWFARHKVKPRLLKRLLEATARRFPQRRTGRHIVAVDATGFSRRPASRYYRLRHGTWQQSYLLWSTLVWIKPRVICAQAARVGPGSQSRRLGPLVTQAQAVLPIHGLRADADYDSEPHHRWLRDDQGIESIIPATRGWHRPARTPYRRRMQTHFPHRKYGQRWLAETVFSVVKRKFGDALTARRPWQQVKQAFLRGLTYNLYRVVQLGLELLRLVFHRAIRAAGVLVT